jgi:hypothetical protein
MGPVTTSTGDRQTTTVQPGAVQVQIRSSQSPRHWDRLLSRAKQYLRPSGINKVALHIARHRSESGTGRSERSNILRSPIPDFHGEAEILNDVHSPLEWLIGKHHFRADG